MTIRPEIRRRQSIRLQDYDYALAGAYFITMVTQDRKCLFGEIVDGEIKLNDCGHIVQDEWEKSAQIRNEIELDAFVVMPNHVHGIVVIADGMRRATGRSPLQVGPAKRSVGAFVAGFKASVSQRINAARGMRGVSVWQRNYFEHVIRSEASLKRIRQYILDNPMSWEFDRENPATQHPEAKYAWRS
ncbi:MAG: transposase [Deltaproteobacteria bacterium]|nr:transposase [Deltaproteobacteria bacterium]